MFVDNTYLAGLTIQTFLLELILSLPIRGIEKFRWVNIDQKCLAARQRWRKNVCDARQFQE